MLSRAFDLTLNWSVPHNLNLVWRFIISLEVLKERVSSEFLSEGSKWQVQRQVGCVEREVGFPPQRDQAMHRVQWVGSKREIHKNKCWHKRTKPVESNVLKHVISQQADLIHTPIWKKKSNIDCFVFFLQDDSESIASFRGLGFICMVYR